MALFPQDADRLRFVPDHPLQKLLFRVGRLLHRRVAEATTGLLTQLLTQRAQRALVRSLVNPVTVLHQPIPVAPRFPSLLSGLGAPLIVGPLNGGMDYPPAFRGSESWFSRATIRAARSLTDLVNALMPGKCRAAVVLVANPRTQAALPSGIQGRIVLMAENGVDLVQWNSLPEAPGTASNTFVFVGRLVDWKALDIVLEALARTPGARLEVLGDGPMLADWRRLAVTLNLTGRVHFLGWQTQPECARRLRQACALVLPSLYECGGAVVLEAMAASKAVIATAWGGPADYLDESCGILVQPTSRQVLVSGFASAMQTLLDSPETGRRMGVNGHARILQHFDWEKKVDALLDLYASVLPPDRPTT